MGVCRSRMRYESWESVDRRPHADFNTKPHVTPSEQTQRFPYLIRKWHADFWSDVRDSLSPLEGGEIASIGSVVRWAHYYDRGVSEWLGGRYNCRNYNFLPR